MTQYEHEATSTSPYTKARWLWRSGDVQRPEEVLKVLESGTPVNRVCPPRNLGLPVVPPQVLAGSLSGRKELVAQVRQLHNVLGGVVDPVSASEGEGTCGRACSPQQSVHF